MNRRGFLRLAGFAVGGSLSGCIGTGGLTSPGTTDGRITVAPEDWPTFGADPANTGYNPDASGPTDEASVVWTFDTGSPTAKTSPVVVGDSVYTGSSGTGGNLYALDAETGEERWEFDTGGRVDHAPAVADGTVFVGTDDRTFHAVDAATGRERWQAGLKHDLRESSPTVVDGTVYVGSAGDSPAVTSDAAVTSDGAKADRSAALFALDAESGEERWSFEVGDWITTAPAVVGGRVYFGDGTGHVRALDAETGEAVWSYETGKRVPSSPTVADGTLYFGAGGTLFALSAGTGAVHWTADLRWPETNSSPAVAGDTVFVGCTRGDECADASGSNETCDSPEHTARLHAVDANHGGERWTYDTKRDVRSSPAVADGTVYLGCAGGLSAIDADDGREAWRVDFGSDVDSSPAVAGGTVFVNCSDGNVYALR